MAWGEVRGRVVLDVVLAARGKTDLSTPPAPNPRRDLGAIPIHAEVGQNLDMELGASRAQVVAAPAPTPTPGPAPWSRSWSSSGWWFHRLEMKM